MAINRVKGVLLVAALSVGALVTGGGAVAHADSAAIQSTSALANTFYTETAGQGSAGAVVSLSTSRSVSYSRSGSVGVSWSIVNAAAGFTVTETITVNYSYQRSAPDKIYCYKVRAFDKWRQYVISWHHVNWGPLPNSSGTFTVKRHVGVSYIAPTPYRKPIGGC